MPRQRRGANVNDYPNCNVFLTFTSLSQLGEKKLWLRNENLFLLIPGINFTNIFCAVLKSRKRLKTWLYFFALSGCACVKAAHEMLMKLTIVINFTNILQAAFSHKRLCKVLMCLHFGLVIYWSKKLLVKWWFYKQLFLTKDFAKF